MNFSSNEPFPRPPIAGTTAATPSAPSGATPPAPAAGAATFNHLSRERVLQENERSDQFVPPEPRVQLEETNPAQFSDLKNSIGEPRYIHLNSRYRALQLSYPCVHPFLPAAGRAVGPAPLVPRPRSRRQCRQNQLTHT